MVHCAFEEWEIFINKEMGPQVHFSFFLFFFGGGWWFLFLLFQGNEKPTESAKKEKTRGLGSVVQRRPGAQNCPLGCSLWPGSSLPRAVVLNLECRSETHGLLHQSVYV